jgi:hypothetical protein
MELKLLLDGFLTGRNYSGVARAGKPVGGEER